MYRSLSLILSVSFALVGILFLFAPWTALRFFNGLSPSLGLTPSPEEGAGFYLALAVGYMYLVSLLAFLMYRHPTDRHFPLLLINGKLATSLLSLFLFIVHGHYLIFIVNTVVDGCIALMVIPFYLQLHRLTK